MIEINIGTRNFQIKPSQGNGFATPNAAPDAFRIWLPDSFRFLEHKLQPNDILILPSGEKLTFLGSDNGIINLSMSPKTLAGIEVRDGKLTQDPLILAERKPGVGNLKIHLSGLEEEWIVNGQASPDQLNRVMSRVNNAIQNGNKEELQKLGFSAEDAAEYIKNQTPVVIPERTNAVQKVKPQKAPAPPPGPSHTNEHTRPDGKPNTFGRAKNITDAQKRYDEEMKEHLRKHQVPPVLQDKDVVDVSPESLEKARQVGRLMGLDPAAQAALAQLNEKNKQATHAANALLAADIGHTTNTGILLYEGNPDLRDKNEWDRPETVQSKPAPHANKHDHTITFNDYDGLETQSRNNLIRKEISRDEMARLSDVAPNGNEWNDHEKKAYQQARERLKNALDGSIDGKKDGTVTTAEIRKAIEGLKGQGIDMKVDVELLSQTLNSGKLPPKQREGR